MKLNKCKLGKYISLCNEKNNNGELTVEDVRGISTQKKFIHTKADMKGVSLKNYKIVRPSFFAYVPDTSRRGDKISLAFNDTSKSFLVSSISVVFKVDTSYIIPEFLYIFFNRPEFDRYARFNSWGSAREPFNWQEMCDIKLYLPELRVQQKIVNLYNSLKQNKESYISGREELKYISDIYIENLRRNNKIFEIRDYIQLRTEQNINMIYGNEDVMGVSQEKKIIPTKSDTKNNDLSKFIIIYPYDFVYNPRNGIAIGLNLFNEKKIISWNNTAFYIKDEYKNILLPEYLMLWFSRSERDRKVKIDSWGSSTEVYSYDELCNTKIPIPNIEVQRSIVNVYNSYIERKIIGDKIENIIKNICPVLIKGAIEEAKK